LARNRSKDLLAGLRNSYKSDVLSGAYDFGRVFQGNELRNGANKQWSK